VRRRVEGADNGVNARCDGTNVGAVVADQYEHGGLRERGDLRGKGELETGKRVVLHVNSFVLNGVVDPENKDHDVRGLGKRERRRDAA
jgi:hypothetical protein